MNTSAAGSPAHRLVWLDVLRFIAIFMVVCCHCTDPFNVSPAARLDPDYNFWGSLYGSFVRPCVPLFAIMTGLLLLPVRQEAGPFYRKRILRVLFPFLIWSALYNLFPWFTGMLGLEPAVITDFFAYAAAPSQSLADSLKNIALIPFNFTVYTTHMWYIYMLIGLYLFMPFFSGWMDKASDAMKRTFFILWIVSLFLPYAHEYISENLFGTCSWNAFGTFYYFAGFAGYLFVGYYFARGVTWSTGKIIGLGLLMFAVGYAITYSGFRAMTALPDATEPQVELFFTYCSPNVFLMTLPILLAVQRIKITSPALTRALANLTKCGYGIYMVHYFFVGIAYLLIGKLHTPVAIQIPVTAVLVFACAWGFTAAVYKLMPKQARWIMG